MRTGIFVRVWLSLSFILFSISSVNASGPSSVRHGGSRPAITSPTAENETVGSAFAYQITATNSPTSYGTANLPGSLWVNTSTGVISGTLTSTGTSTFTVMASNSAGTGSATVTLTVNSSPSSSSSVPAITSSTTASGTLGAAFSYQLTASNSPTSYAAKGLPAGLSVNASSGLISGTPTASGTSSVTLSAANSAGTGNATLTLTISSNAAPTITSPLSATGTVGSSFSYQITGSNSSTSYGTANLPGSLWVNTSTGVISGTLTSTGTSTFTVMASNSAGTGSAAVTLTVNSSSNSSSSVPAITSSTTASGTVGTAFSYKLTASNSPTSYAAKGLPAGLSVNTSSGLISGTPTASGTSSVTLTAANSAGTGNATLTLSVSAGAGLQAQIAATPSSVAFGTVTDGTTDSMPITLKNGGNTTLTFSGIGVTGAGFSQTGLSTSTTIAAGGTTTFNATFDPTSTSPVTGTITLTTNGTPSSLAINLSGTGQAAATLLGVNPTSLSFGGVLDKGSSSLTTLVTNSGNSSVTVSGVTVTGAGFTASGIPNGTVLTSGQSATLTVTFAPVSGGAISGASVRITSNATNSPLSIGLTGTGLHSVVLNWGASSTDGVAYNIFRGTSSGGEGTAPINPVAITALTYTDTNVTPGTDYYYIVEAMDSSGSSAPSNEAVEDIPNP